MADDTGQGPENQDEMRLCPTCRMKVSVWATKCHHCGEEVGRPRREEMKLTLKDLGGGQKTTYAPSGNVTGALESFRMEEVSNQETLVAQRRKLSLLDRLLGRKLPPIPARPTTPNIPELDEYNRNLTASILDDIPGSSSVSISRAQMPQYQRSPLQERAVQVVVVAVALGILYFGGSFAWAKISDYIASRNQQQEFVYNNRAREMLAQGDAPIVAFEEAMAALGYNDTQENHEIADQTRALVLKEVSGLIARNPWSRKDQDEAFSIIQRAINVDTHPSVKAMFESVAADVSMFRFVLKSVDTAAEEATFRPNNPNYEPEVTVKVADRFMDRFIVNRIFSGGVDLNDDGVPGRKLTISVNEGVRSRY